MSERFWKSSLGVAVVLAAFGADYAVAQDYSAGKTAAQLFASDCSACHKSPAGLAKGMDTRSLTSFLREHYTTKAESAAILAAYVSGAGPGDARTKPEKPNAEAGPKPDAKPDAKPRPAAGTAETEPGPKPKPRATAATEPKPGEADTIESKLNSYAAAGGDVKATERLADRSKKLESYATSGTAADAITPTGPKDAAAPADTGAANAAAMPAGDDVNATRKRKGSDKKKNDAAAAPATTGDRVLPPRPPHRAQAPAIQQPQGNN